MEAAPASIPYSLEAEKSVLGSMMLSPTALDLAVEQLSPEDFYLPAHQDIYACMQQLRNANKPVDSVTLVAELDRLGKLAAVGDAAYIGALYSFTPTAASAAHYIAIVSERSTQRQLIHAGNDIAADGLDTEKDIAAMLSDAERRIYDISMRRATDTLKPVQETMFDTFTRMGELMNLRGALTGVPSGFMDLDAMTSGFQKSDLVIIAGRPSMGKTSFAMNIAGYAAMQKGMNVIIFSLEMSREQLIMRMFATEAEVNMQNIKTGSVSEAEMSKLSDVLGPMSESRLFIDDSAAATVPEIRSKCRRHKAKNGLDMIVIDYLQLMQSARKSDSRQLEISEITRSLKVLARELDVPILLLSQLSRAPEQRTDHHPMMADLRESGAIEQDADVILLLYREQVYDAEAGNEAEVIIAKHRNGPTGVVKLVWLGEITKFKNMAYQG